MLASGGSAQRSPCAGPASRLWCSSRPRRCARSAPPSSCGRTRCGCCSGWRSGRPSRRRVRSRPSPPSAAHGEPRSEWAWPSRRWPAPTRQRSWCTAGCSRRSCWPPSTSTSSGSGRGVSGSPRMGRGRRSAWPTGAPSMGTWSSVPMASTPRCGRCWWGMDLPATPATRRGGASCHSTGRWPIVSTPASRGVAAASSAWPCSAGARRTGGRAPGPARALAGHRPRRRRRWSVGSGSGTSRSPS